MGYDSKLDCQIVWLGNCQIFWPPVKNDLVKIWVLLGVKDRILGCYSRKLKTAEINYQLILILVFDITTWAISAPYCIYTSIYSKDWDGQDGSVKDQYFSNCSLFIRGIFYSKKYMFTLCHKGVYEKLGHFTATVMLCYARYIYSKGKISMFAIQIFTLEYTSDSSPVDISRH